MFGYVTPCKMELKIKDFEKFNAYYCGLCMAIKRQYGNFPRLSLNYDMTFLGILLDSLEDVKCTFRKHRCLVHPLKNKLIIVDNKALDYAAYCNVTLAYYKLLDNVKDDKSLTSKVSSMFLGKYLNSPGSELAGCNEYIKKRLAELSSIENSEKPSSLDETAHPFADLTGYIISSYIDNKTSIKDSSAVKTSLYWLGYYLGKWIYIIDAWDDLEKDMGTNKFNPLNNILNHRNVSYAQLKSQIEERVDFLLVSCASNCVEHLNSLPLYKNMDLLSNILQYGLMEKMDTVFKRSEFEDAKPL
jgi:hypothetical protein